MQIYLHILYPSNYEKFYKTDCQSVTNGRLKMSYGAQHRHFLKYFLSPQRKSKDSRQVCEDGEQGCAVKFSPSICGPSALLKLLKNEHYLPLLSKAPFSPSVVKD